MNNINPTISIITVNVNKINAPVEGQSVTVNQENKTQLYFVYKKPTLNIMTNTD